MGQVYHTVQNSQKKICAMCGKEKVFTDFHKMKSTRDGFRPSCKDCRRDRITNPQPIVQKPLFLFSRKCTKCKIEKDICFFNKMAKGPYGYHTQCKNCQSEYNQQHRIEHIDEYKARSHSINILPRTKSRKMERHRERMITDPHYIELRKQSSVRYYRSHKTESKERYHRYQFRKRNATTEKVNFAYILERDGMVCHICGKSIDPHAKKRSTRCLTFDHIIPLKPRPGDPQGTHSVSNIKPAHLGCNVRKGNKPMDTLTDYDRRGVDYPISQMPFIHLLYPGVLKT